MTALGFSADRDVVAEGARIAAYLESELGCSEIVINRMRRWRPIMQADSQLATSLKMHRTRRHVCLPLCRPLALNTILLS
jgi:hypothetical protein